MFAAYRNFYGNTALNIRFQGRDGNARPVIAQSATEHSA
jgi:hypothetical protein